MPKQHKIKWREIDEAKARKAIKNFNAKIDYQKRVHPELSETLPEKMSMKDFKKNVATRADFNRKMKSVQNFSKRGVEKAVTNIAGEKTSVWRLQETKKNVARINRQRKKEYEQLNNSPVYIDGKKVENVARMAEIQTKKSIKFDFDKSKKGEFEQFAKWAEKEMTDSKQAEAPIWFLNNLAEVAYGNFSAENAKKLMELYYKVGGERLLQLYHSGHEEISPDWQYNEPIEEQEMVERIVELLTPYAK